MLIWLAKTTLDGLFVVFYNTDNDSDNENTTVLTIIMTITINKRNTQRNQR